MSFQATPASGPAHSPNAASGSWKYVMRSLSVCSTSSMGSATSARIVNYETGKAGAKARSLWRLEPLRISWSGSHIRWGQPFRLRHLTRGHYLALTDDRGLVLQDREKADTTSTAFCFRSSKRDMEGMGLAEIKYGDSLCFVMHVATGLWLSYQAPTPDRLKGQHLRLSSGAQCISG
ncbi:hypothetical protein CRUP_013384 [Coryphaenoides rupestris]|nr:hypothetical protein CRUP_013384 [Coryphaenoides rupestris]